MALELTEDNVLPDGTHVAEIEEVREVFGGFQHSTRRLSLFKKLEEYLSELKKAEIGVSVILDGSFVMGCIDEPEDIDIILVLSDTWDMKQILRPFQYNLVSYRAVKRNFPFDLFPATSGSEAEAEMIEYFSQVNTKWYEEHGFETGATKGLVRILL